MKSQNLQYPDRLASLPAAVASKHLTHSVLGGRERPPAVALQRASVPLPIDEVRWNSAPVRELVEQAMARFEGSRTSADAWLAPRLHATLRMTRSEAADPGVWNFLALAVAPDYVHWRHGRAGAAVESAVSPARYTGNHYSHAFARLWWAAELFRDGDDYRPVVTACGNQDILNTTLRLAVIDHRPTAQAIVRVLAGLADAGTSRLGDHVNALSSAVNTAGSTIVYDVIAPDDVPDADSLLDWIADAQQAAPVAWESLPDGPDDGRVRLSSVEALVRFFHKLHSEAPLRQRKAGSEAQDS
ncbi:DUF6339 family protein [Kitasatospora indigofera]|uniref:DUF6339 family protein n=1 Tax=Kitasatospora indigofera TaxID=67307 RepID=UPI003690BC81